MRKNVKIIAALLTCLILITALAACSDSEVPDGYQLIACEGDEFRLYVPTDWVDNTSSGVTCAYYSSDADISVSATVAGDASADTALDDYWALCNARYEAEYEEYTLIPEESGQTVLGAKDARRYVFTAKLTTYDEKSGESIFGTYKLIQVFAKNNGKIYILTFIAPQDRYDGFKEIMLGDKDGNGIINHFRFAEPYEADDDKKISDKVEAPEGMKLASTDERAYRLFVPEGWIISERSGATVVHVSETDRSNVNVQMYMTSNTAESVEEHWTMLSSRYEKTFAEFELISDEKLTVDGVPAHKYTYRAVSGGQEYKITQAIYKKQNSEMIYTVTFTASPEKFGEHADEVDSIIENFRIRKFTLGAE